MADALHLMLWPLAACLVLTGILSYFGLHIVSRGVIFVDLALAQVAALGTTVAFAFGYDLHGHEAHAVSLISTFVGAAVFSLTRTRDERIPQEAIIGIIYAVCAAAAILAVDRAPQGAEHIKSILIGDILLVSHGDVFGLFAICLAVGAFHFFARRRFFLISAEPRKAFEQGLAIRLWDFLFYVSFGLVVTSAVCLAGVLMVFSYLIVPAVCALLFCRGFTVRLAIGWLLGLLTSLLGLYGSYRFDLPTGATIVCAFGAVLIFCALIRLFLPGQAAGPALQTTGPEPAKGDEL